MPQQRSGGGKVVAGVDGNWACPQCQNVNFAVRVACNRCQAPKPRDVVPAGGKGGAFAGHDGNWTCPQCQNVNFAAREACNRCKTPKFSVVQPPRYLQQPQRSGPTFAGQDGNWTCPQCQNVNFPLRTVCNRCQALKPPMPPLPPRHAPQPQRSGLPAAGQDGNWNCPQCQNVNFPMRSVCNRCQAPRPQTPQQRFVGGGPPQQRGGPVAGVDGAWECPQCQNVNFAVREACNRCQAPKHVIAHLAPPNQYGCGNGVPARVAPPHQMQPMLPVKFVPPMAGVDGNWACAHCQNINFAVREACNRCQMPKVEMPSQIPQKRPAGKGPPVAGVDGNWQCPSCANINFAMRDACNRCQEPKPLMGARDGSELDFLGELAEDADPSAKRLKLV